MAAEAIRVEGLKELQRTLRKAIDEDIPARLGDANRSIGELVISRLSPAPDPLAVGVGGNAAVRPSSSKRDVLLRVGGAYRAKPPLSVWGKKSVAPTGKPRPLRPHILGTVEQHQAEIEDAYLDAIAEALNPADGGTP